MSAAAAAVALPLASPLVATAVAPDLAGVGEAAGGVAQLLTSGSQQAEAQEEQGFQQQQQQQQAGGAPAFCERESLTGLLRQFAVRQEGFDSGLQFDGLLSYYRRLGCSQEQLQAAVRGVVPPGGTGPPGALSALAGQELMGQLQLAAWQLLAAALAAAALAVYQSRPRGWSRQDLLEVRSSTIAGRGVFSRAPIPAGTVLGAYPGRLRSPAEMLAKCEGAPLAASYAFRTGDGRFLDPTDFSGQPSIYPQPGWPWLLPTDVLLSYVNEPPKGSPGTNATVEDGREAGELLFVACVDVMAGAELLIDYGLTYDRSGYKAG